MNTNSPYDVVIINDKCNYIKQNNKCKPKTYLCIILNYPAAYVQCEFHISVPTGMRYFLWGREYRNAKNICLKKRI